MAKYKKVGGKNKFLPTYDTKRKLSTKDWKEIAHGEWYWYVSPEEGLKAHAQNIKACERAIDGYNKKDRPLRVLVVHGSGRNTDESCAHERSNSAMFLEKGLEAIEGDENIEVEAVHLRHYNISYCNGCYSSSSAHCHFPCTCHPLDPMQDLYPKILAADVLLISTGVNQSAMSSRLKAFCDRMISCDGGFYMDVKQFKDKFGGMKNSDTREAAIAIEKTKKFNYEQRLHGRVCAYFISSKDQNNTFSSVSGDERPLNYAEITAQSLKDGMEDYGMFHAKKWYAKAASNPNVGMYLDKETLSKNTKAHKEAKEVVKQAINLARKLRKKKPKPVTDRINRT